MNFYSNYRFTLDIQKSKSQVSIPVHYGDTGNRFYITFTDGGNPYIIPEGCRADIYIKKPEPHKPLVNACIIENNALIRYEFNTHTASVEGMHKCELRLYSADGRIITSPSFVMVVDQRVVYDDEIGTEEDFNRLIALDVIATEEARVAAEEERVENENKRIEAEAERDEAERARAEAELRRENENAGRNRGGYDLVITSEDEFDQCLYPLYKDEENLTRDQAALKVTEDGAFNTPDPEFAAKRVLVKGVTFKKMRGYDDVRLHIFQPSIEYIKFDNCRWETHWKVSGKNPRDTSAMNCNLNTAPERATAFKRATDPLTLVIEGLHITEDNTSVARASDQWGVGLRNVKALKNCYIDYPKGYKITPEGYAALEMSCQFFDFADNCKISGLWDGTNVVNCKVSKILKRCANVANAEAVNLLDQSGAAVPLSVEYCSNMVNLKGNVTLVSCTSISATREEAQAYANTAEENAKGYTDGKVATRRALLSGDGLNSGERFVYSVNKDIDPATGEATVNQYRIHARTSANAGEIPLRTPHGTLLSPQEWSTSGYDYSNMSKWTPATLMPRNYIDTWFPKLNGAKKISTAHLPPYAPLVEGKVPANYLPSYVDDVIEGYYLFNNFFKENDIHSESLEKASGKIYLDLNTEKTYRWSGTKFVEISSSSIPTAEDIGVYTKDEVDDKIDAITAEDIGAVQKYVCDRQYGLNDFLVYAHDPATNKVDMILATERALGYVLPKRDGKGHLIVPVDPQEVKHAASKKYVDDKIYTEEATDNNGAYGAKFSDARYYISPKKTDMAYKNTYYIPVSRLTTGNNDYPKVEEFVITPKEPSVTVEDAFAVRGAGGQIYVPSTPTAPSHAASKKYVEDYIAGTSFDFTLTGIDDGSERSITLCDGDTVIHGIIGTRDGATNAIWTGGSKCSFSIFIPNGCDYPILSDKVWVKDKDWDTVPVYVECRCDETKNATLRITATDGYTGGDVSFIRIVGKVAPA